MNNILKHIKHLLRKFLLILLNKHLPTFFQNQINLIKSFLNIFSEESIHKNQAYKTFYNLASKIHEHQQKILNIFNSLQIHNYRLDTLDKAIIEFESKITQQSDLLEKISATIKNISDQLEESKIKIENHNSQIHTLSKGIKELRIAHEKSISAIGARWGMRAEQSFRSALKSILEEENGVKVEYYVKYDSEGMVFDQPDQIELDIIIKSGKIIVLELKSSVSKGDVFTFSRKISFYEKQEQKSVYRKIIVSPMIDFKALEFAKKLGIEVCSSPYDIDIGDRH